jgi:hypothetical protein
MRAASRGLGAFVFFFGVGRRIGLRDEPKHLAFVGGHFSSVFAAEDLVDLYILFRGELLHPPMLRDRPRQRVMKTTLTLWVAGLINRPAV